MALTTRLIAFKGTHFLSSIAPTRIWCQRPFVSSNASLGASVRPLIARRSRSLYDRLGNATKLVFVPAASREKDEPLDLHKEAFVSHRGVFLDIGQFAFYVAKILKLKQKPLPLVYGWKGQIFVPDGDTSEAIAKDLILPTSMDPFCIPTGAP